TYVNGVFLPRPRLTNLALGDLEKVEILRGPQGTLYGRNATGGAINYVTVKPSEELEVSGTVGAGSFGRYNGEMAISGPLWGDLVQARLFGRYAHTDGSIENLSSLGD